MLPGIVLMAMPIFITSCIREEFHLNEDLSVVGEIQPSWALPLGQLNFSLNDHWNILDSLQIEMDETNGMLQFVQPFEAFSSAPLLMEPLEESLAFQWVLDDVFASILSLLPADQSVSHESALDWNWGIDEMTALDSLWLDSSSLSVHVSSNLPMDCEVLIRSVSIVSEGQPFECWVTLDYTGSLPVIASQSISIDNSSVLFPDPTNPSVRLEWEVVCIGGGADVSPGDGINIEVSANATEIEAVFGDFRGETSWSFEMGQSIPVLDNLISGDVHFADPQIHLWMNNSSGIPIGLEWSELKFLNNGLPFFLSGPDIEDFPVIAAALTPGDDAETAHIIDNSGTSPALSTILDVMPDSLQISGAIVINPELESQSFLLSTSRVALEGELRLPMNGWASAMSWRDTVNVNISESLKNALRPPLDWEDLLSVSVRFSCENRLPIGVQVQALFLNDQGQAIDSLSSNADGWQLIEAGHVDSQGTPNSINFGRVVDPRVQTMDWIFEREMAQELMAQNCQSVVIHAMLETSQAAIGQDVRFYPDDGLSVELGLKLDFDLSLNP